MDETAPQNTKGLFKTKETTRLGGVAFGGLLPSSHGSPDPAQACNVPGLEDTRRPEDMRAAPGRAASAVWPTAVA